MGELLSSPGRQGLRALPGGECIVVANAWKWAEVGGIRFNSMIVDEAYQMTSAKLLRIADLFPTLDMVGDPGQLDPFSTIDEDPWVGLPQNPVLNSVDERHTASASGFNSAVARTGGLIATALLGTVLAAHGPALLAAFHGAMIAGAAACALAALCAFALVAIVSH